jgi:hypothetical protein
MATRLTKLDIDETSGVANPANELPGFLVMKSAEDAEALLKEADRMESDFAILYSALKACEPYLGEAPEEVVAAKETLTAYVEGLFGDEETDEAEPATAEAPPTEVYASADGRKGLLARILHRGEPKPEPTTKENEVTEPAETEPEATEPEAVAAKPAPDDVTKALARIEESLTGIVETQSAHAEVLDHALDRISNVEARRQGLTGQEAETVRTAKSSEDRGAAALRSGIMAVARGGSVRLG